jgi:hypothetical protein
MKLDALIIRCCVAAVLPGMFVWRRKIYRAV